MRAGRYDEAWALCDGLLRLPQAPGTPRHFQRVWDGSAPDGRRVLLRSYHGLGDAFQFLRFAPLLRERAAGVDLWVQRELIPLLEGVPGVDRLIPLTSDAPPAGYDLGIEVMELGHLFRATIETLPPPLRLFGSWRSLAHGGPLRVGLVWRAGDWEPERSIPSPLLARLAGVPVEWRIFQRGIAREEASFGVPAGSPDLLPTAREMLGLDLMVTVDSMAAHLAGSLGVPTWVLLRKEADWRWLEGREDSPWYPSARLFRQSSEGDWRGVLERVASELSK